MSATLLADLEAGRTVELEGRALGVRAALGFTASARTGIVVQVHIKGRLVAAFSVLSASPLGFDATENTGERIAAGLREPFTVSGRETFVTASIGIAVEHEGGEADEIIRNADIAMYLAKRRGKDRRDVFKPGMQLDALKPLELEADLRRAVEQRQFFIVYQPIIDLERGTASRC